MKRFSRLIYFSLLILMLSACDSDTIQTVQVDNSDTDQIHKLRIVNNGLYPIENLEVSFPDEKIIFGDVNIGETTEYIDVPKGVYSYAAYRFEIDGNIKLQAVIDWVGEYPMDGSLFTYVIDFDFNRFEMNDAVRLIEVKVDK